MLQPLRQLINRVSGYLQEEPFEVIAELAVIWAVVYIIYRFVRGTRGAWAIKGVAVLLITGTLLVQILGQGNALERLNFLYSNFLQFATIMLVIVFQPELRRAMVRLGETRFFNKQTGLRRAKVVEELLTALENLSRKKIGALVAIERQVGLRGVVEQGTLVDAEVSHQLLETIFWPNTALHDLGVVIRGDRVLAAGVQFPLAEAETVQAELGSRHRAAIGLSQETDALILVVSEETGLISIAERGVLTRGVSIEQTRSLLTKGMNKVVMDLEPTDVELDTKPERASKDNQDPPKKPVSDPAETPQS